MTAEQRGVLYLAAYPGLFYARGVMVRAAAVEDSLDGYLEVDHTRSTLRLTPDGEVLLEACRVWDALLRGRG